MDRDKKNNDTVNILMNIENYFGEHNGGFKKAILFICISALPFLLYVFFLISIIPLKWVIVFEVLWTVRMALFILGEENQKLEVFMESVNDEYAAADNLVRIAHLHDDGLIEYENGTVAYILSAYAGTYFSNDAYSLELEEFMKRLEHWVYDVTCQLVTEEFRLQNNMDNMSVYTSPEIMKERMDFYMTQDEYCESQTELYRINFIVKTSKYNWKKLRRAMDELVSSAVSKVFFDIHICNKEQANDILSRDLCVNIDLEQMLLTKYKNSDYNGSKIVYYDDEIPKKFRPKEEVVDLESRRVIYNGEVEE